MMIAGVLALAAAAPAHAGSYRLWTCQGPDGKPAPIRDATSGWQPQLRGGTQFMTLADRCGSGGGIHAHMGGTQPRAAGGQWVFIPPPGTSLGSFSIIWSGTVSGGGEASLSRSDQPDPTYVERHGGPFGTHTVTQSGFDIASLAAIAACSFQDPCGADAVDFTIARAVLTLNDFATPAASQVAGELISAPVLRGPMSVSFAGKDVGGGLYRVVVTADGRDVTGAALPDPAGRCKQVDAQDGHAFQWPQPCPLELQATVTVDTTLLPEGRHTIGVALEDAAGNRTALLAPTLRTVVHRGAFNGGDGATLKRAGRYTVTTSFARRKPLLRGALTRNGVPVPGALLDVLAQIRTSGAPLVKVGEARTDAQGRYSVRAPAGPSRRLRVAYKAYLGDPEYASHTDVSHRVRARVDLRARTRRIGLRGTARFSGAVRGGYVPRRGKVIELQAHDGGRWRTFTTLRTRRNGRFTARYSFRRSTVSRTYRFRARARYEPSYPFVLGISRTVRVRVGQ